jgi:hypothetical protein
MGYCFDVVDVTSPDMEVLYNRLKELSGTTVLRYMNLSGAPYQAGSDILARSGPRGAFVVRIWGHGLPGVVPIGAGLIPEYVAGHQAGLILAKDFKTDTYYNNVAPSADSLRHASPGLNVTSGAPQFLSPTLRFTTPALKFLAAAMNPAGRVELHGCVIARGKVGEEFGKQLAKVLGCWVYASSEFQRGLEWEPPVLGFPPGGKGIIANAKAPPLKFKYNERMCEVPRPNLKEFFSAPKPIWDPGPGPVSGPSCGAPRPR